MTNALEWLGTGGPTIYVILAASVIGLACIIYCMLILRRSVLLPADLVQLAETVKEQDQLDAALASCQQEGGPFAEILLTVIATREASREEAEALVEGAGRRAAHELSRGPLALEVVAAVSPLLGLLGTVMGMYETFEKINLQGVKEVGMLSGGIKEALVTTICGLIVAIPAFVAQSWFNRKVDSLVLEMERYAMSLMGRLRK